MASNEERPSPSELFQESKKSDEFWIELATLEFTESVLAEMEKQGVTKTELAKRLGKSQPLMTKVFRGSNNFTIASMVKIARRLGLRFTPTLKAEEKP